MPKNNTIYVLKCVGIMLIVLEHVMTYQQPVYYDNAFICMLKSFSMPAFMALSGYVIAGKKLDDTWLFKKGKKFGIIVFAFSALYWAWAVLVPQWSMLKSYAPFLSYMVFAFSTGYGDTVLWYIFVLLQCYMILWLSTVISKNWPKINVAIPIYAIIVILNILPYYYMFGLGWLKWYGLFMLTGYVVGLHKEWFKKFLWVTYPAIGMFALFGYLTNWMTNWQNTEYALGGHAWILRDLQAGQFVLLGVTLSAVILGALAFIGVGRLLNKIKYANKVLAYVGTLSLGVYLIHPLFIGIAKNIFVATILDVGICIVVYLAWKYLYSKVRLPLKAKEVTA